MNEINLRKLNNLNLENNFNHIINYKINGTFPDSLKDNEDIDRFITKFDKFRVDNNRLFYGNLEVIKKNNIDNVLQGIYNDNKVGLGHGITQFYLIVTDKFLNITRKEVERFLKRQPDYQLTSKPPPKRVKTQRYFKENVAWALDLIDISRYSTHNKNFRYILSMVDLFSKKVYLRAIKRKTAESVNAVLRPIFEVENPKLIISDNGGEFAGINLDLMHEFNIKSLTTPSHTPQSNIENVNGQVRKFLSKLLVKYMDDAGRPLFKWIDVLEDIEDNINNYNGLQRNVLKRQKKADKLKGKKSKPVKNKFKIGDKVRVTQQAFESHVRKEYKAGLMKYIHIKYSIIVLTVHKIHKPNNKHNVLPYYILKKEDNTIVENLNNEHARRFKENELLLVPNEGDINHDKYDNNLRINGIER